MADDNEKFGLKETFVSPDFAVGLAAAAGGIYVADTHPEQIGSLVGVLAALAAVVIGTAIAGVAIQAALMSDAFLRRVREIGREPTYFLRHWIFTVTVGVLAALATGVLAGVPVSAPAWFLITVTAVACGLTGWVLGCIVSAVVSLKGFVLLRADAAGLPDQVTSIEDARRQPPSGAVNGS